MAVNMPPAVFIIRVLCHRDQVTDAELRATWARVEHKTTGPNSELWFMDLSDRAVASAVGQLETCRPNAVTRGKGSILRKISTKECHDWFWRWVGPQHGTYNHDDFWKDRAVAFDKLVREALEENGSNA